MKTIKLHLFSLMMLVSLSSFSATHLTALNVSDPFSEEISKMLSRSSLIVEKDFTIKVFFTLTEDKMILIKSISSSNEMANKFLRARLSGQQLKGDMWQVHKVYELPVWVKAIR